MMKAGLSLYLICKFKLRDRALIYYRFDVRSSGVLTIADTKILLYHALDVSFFLSTFKESKFYNSTKNTHLMIPVKWKDLFD